MRTLPIILWCLLLLPAALFAQNQLSLGELQNGQLVLNLSATEQLQVNQDTLNATLGFSLQGRDQVALQNQINAAIQQALSSAKAVAAVKVQTGYYQVYQVQNEPGIFNADNPVWRASQSLQLESLDSAALLTLVGSLQGLGLTVENLYYSLSADSYERARTELTTQILQTLQQRAQNAGIALGKPSASLIEVNLDGNANVAAAPELYAMAARGMDAKVTTPSAEPGETTVSVTVSARAILSP